MTDETGKVSSLAEEIIRRYPKLYHMAHRGSWRSIRRHGLRSTRALLDLFDIQNGKRTRILTEHRPETVKICHPEYGEAYVRDQKPMSDASLKRALEGSDLAPADWYELLNEKVFFWLTRDRLNRMLNARAYRDKSHDVLVVDTESLIRSNQDRVVLSSLNSGCTIPFPHSRGEDTIQPLEEYPFFEWDDKRSGNSTEPVVELAVVEAVLDIWDHVVSVEVRKAENLIGIEYSSD